jgi:hypothetical protein
VEFPDELNKKIRLLDILLLMDQANKNIELSILVYKKLMSFKKDINVEIEINKT